MSKGIIIIACGVEYYGELALNLCMSLKATDPDISVTLLWEGKSKNRIQSGLHIFDNVLEISKEHLNRSGMKSLMRSKVCLDLLSPYDETIFIDADVIMNPYKKISNLFDELKYFDFTIGCREKVLLSEGKGRFQWADAEAVAKAMKYDGESYNLSSELIYFKKTEDTSLFFQIAREYFDNPEVEYKRFAGTVPDELAFQLAMIKTGMKPHASQFLPFYWEPYQRKKFTAHEFYNSQWYGYSMGGAFYEPRQKEIYDSLATHYSQKFGRPFVFKAKNKSEVTKLRSKI